MNIDLHVWPEPYVWATSTGATVDADARGYAKIRVIRVLHLDGSSFSYQNTIVVAVLCAIGCFIII